MLLKLSFLIALPLLGGCYGVPMEAELRIEVVPRQSEPAADGVGLADVFVHASEADAAFRRTLSLSASSGTWAFAGADGSSGSSLTLATPESGPAELVLRYGRTAGPVVIQAQLDNRVERDESLTLMPRRPDQLQVVARPARLQADGLDTAQVQVTFATTDTGQVSFGSQVALHVCCDEEGVASECVGEPKLTAPERLILRETELSTGSVLEFEVSAAYVPRTSTVSADIRVWLLAAVGETPPTCEAALSDDVVTTGMTLVPVDG